MRDAISNKPMLSAQGNSLGGVTTVMAYSEEFLLIWWQTVGSVIWTEVTVTVYNIGKLCQVKLRYFK